MIPRQLLLQNFLSYGDEPQTLDFTGFHVACLSGPNGNGKSALLDAITWALWGQARKGRHDRKPDEGLLHLGAQQMRVDFTFDLDDGTYRVLRRFRRRPSSNVTELELQVRDEAADRWRPLAEAGAVGVTQERIDRLLSMDYETFVHSAFLLQGQADAFTGKGPRERKELLGRILGLARYDRLQEQARRRQQERASALTALRQRLDAIAVELEERPAVTARLRQTDDHLAATGRRLESAEEEQRLWHERSLRADALAAERQRCAADLADLEAATRRLHDEQRQLCERRASDARWLEQADRIEADVVRLRHLQTEIERLDDLREADQAVATELAEVQRRVDAARHQVEQRQATWTARRDSLDERLRSFDEVLGEAAQIEARHAELLRQREELDGLRRRRRQWEEARAAHDAATHEIALEERRLSEERRGLDRRLDEVRRRIAEAADVARRVDAAEAELEGAGKTADEMRQLREEGTRARAQQTHLAQRLDELGAQSIDLDERVAALGRGDLQECPLCGTDLDAEHRRRMDAELADARADLGRRRAAIEEEARQADDRLADLTRRFRQLEQSTPDLGELQQRVALLRARRARLDEDEATAAQLLTEASALARRLDDGNFAPDARQAQAAARLTMERLAFDPERFAAIEEAARDEEGIDARYRLLQGARQDRERTEAERAQAQAQVDAAAEELSSGRFALAHDDERQRLQTRREELAYDAERHAAARATAQQLAQAPVEQEKLRAARERDAGAAETEARLQQEADRCRTRRVALDERREQLRVDLEALREAPQKAAGAAQAVSDLRRERDQLLQRRGTLQARSEQLERLMVERTELGDRRREQEREEWLYAQLVDAFGKDGIQALVIEGAIPEIEEEANAILSRLTDNRIQVTIESLRDLKGGGSRETLDVKIADELGERSYALYSGGEAFRTDFALRIALSKVLARRAGTRLRTLIIDEGFGTQDARGLERLADAIQLVSRDFDKVLVVTHLEELKDAFPVRIEVTKDAERGSRFAVLG